MTRWSFHLQVYFLSQRFSTHREITSSHRAVVQDRSIYEDAEIFAKNLHAMGRMDARDYENYVALYRVMTDYLKPPDLMIYLKAGTETLARQIRLRGRSFEQNIEPAYLERLNTLYNEWIAAYTLGPVITIDVDATDFVHDAQQQADLLYRIDHAVPKRR
jgi:deoxyadenosine/deoxycytidine kinase